MSQCELNNSMVGRPISTRPPVSLALPEATVARLIGYRRLLDRLQPEGRVRVFSHELAAMLHLTAAQVRRDIMLIGHTGSPARGYDVVALRDHIVGILHPAGEDRVALIGVGQLGRALLGYFGPVGRPTIVAAFDVAPEKIGIVINGVRCYDLSELEPIIQQQNIRTAIVATPGAEAVAVVERLVKAGVTGVLNFAPSRLRVPAGVHLEYVDIAAKLEKVCFFARPESRALEETA